MHPNESPELRTAFLALVDMYTSQSGSSYIEAILESCIDLDLEPDDIVKYITKPIKEKLMAEGQNINILQKTTKLPV